MVQYMHNIDSILSNHSGIMMNLCKIYNFGVNSNMMHMMDDI